MKGLVWAPAALRDLLQIGDHIAQDSERAALDVTTAIWNAVDGLLDYPHRGRQGRVDGTRELVISGLPYLVVYEADGSGSIAILRVIHGAMLWPAAGKPGKP